MSQVSKNKLLPTIEKRIYEIFIDSVKNSRSSEDTASFLNDLLSPIEKIMLSKRVVIAVLLVKEKYTYDEISYLLKVSRGTVAKVSVVLQAQENELEKTVKKIISNKKIQDIFSDIIDVLNILPHKGGNWNKWKKDKIKREQNRNSPI